MHNPAMNKEEVKRIIPHREPMLLVDEIAEVGDKYIVGKKKLVPEMVFFNGHFPGHPIFPGVLQVEAIAQTAACYVLAKDENKGKLVYFAGIDEVRGDFSGHLDFRFGCVSFPLIDELLDSIQC